MSNTSTQRLRIAKAKTKKYAYHLTDGGEVIGALELGNRHGSFAKAVVGNRALALSRPSLLKREIHIEGAGTRQPAVFTSNWLCRGSVFLDGKLYHFAPANARWSTWAWSDSDGTEILRLTVTHHFLEMEGEVRGESDLTKDENKYLVLLGWYMLLLHHQEFDAFVAAGLKRSLAKLGELGKKKP